MANESDKIIGQHKPAEVVQLVTTVQAEKVAQYIPRRLMGQPKPKPEPDKINDEALPQPKIAPTKPAETKQAVVQSKPTVAVPLTFQHSRNPNGIATSWANAFLAIDALEIDCRYDDYHDRIIVKGQPCETGGDALENLDNVTLKVRQAVLLRFGFDPGAQFTLDAIRARCLDRTFDPVRDYLDTLEWDGCSRVDTWLRDYCGADDTPLNRAIGRKMLLAAVRRVRTPGCKFDYIVVLEGAQGTGKSTLLKLLAGDENFSDNEIIGLDKREQQEAIQGIWIYEIAELAGLAKSDVRDLKLFASKTVDSARPAYGRTRVDRKRRGIFVATTNEDTYLRDATGNRRFWPAKIRQIDLAGIAADRDQLWAEAAAIEARGEGLVIPEALWPDAAAQQQARMELDPWTDEIGIHLARLQRLTGSGTKIAGDGFVRGADKHGNPEWRVASDYLLKTVIGLPPERQHNNHTKRLADVMRTLGWTLHETTLRFGPRVCRGYTKPAEE